VPDQPSGTVSLAPSTHLGVRSVCVQFPLLLAVLMGLSSSAATQERPQFDHLVVFGDSLSDTGNAGRFSNGPVWVEQVADTLKLPLIASNRGGQNFAVGGARVEDGPQSIRAQVAEFLKQPPPSGHTLYVIWGGGNDVLAAIGQPDALSKVTAAGASLKSIVAQLVAHGASDLLVPNLPDVSITPEVQAHGSAAIAEGRRLSLAFNQAVEQGVQDVVHSSTSFRLYRVDVAAMAERARKDPASYGFTNISAPCGGTSQCENYLFWDEIHPTTEAHARLAEAALRALSSDR
jgi:phospholipase/lecithinase/hemolysin